MDKEKLEKRLNTLLEMKESHTQDLLEIQYTIEGIRKQIDLIEEIEEVEEQEN